MPLPRFFPCQPPGQKGRFFHIAAKTLCEQSPVIFHGSGSSHFLYDLLFTRVRQTLTKSSCQEQVTARYAKVLPLAGLVRYYIPKTLIKSMFLPPLPAFVSFQRHTYVGHHCSFAKCHFAPCIRLSYKDFSFEESQISTSSRFCKKIKQSAKSVCLINYSYITTTNCKCHLMRIRMNPNLSSTTVHKSFLIIRKNILETLIYSKMFYLSMHHF